MLSARTEHNKSSSRIREIPKVIEIQICKVHSHNDAPVIKHGMSVCSVFPEECFPSTSHSPFPADSAAPDLESGESWDKKLSFPEFEWRHMPPLVHTSFSLQPPAFTHPAGPLWTWNCKPYTFMSRLSFSKEINHCQNPQINLIF